MKKIEGYWRQTKEEIPDLPFPKIDVLSLSDARLISHLIELKELNAHKKIFKGLSYSRIDGSTLGCKEYELDNWAWPGDFRSHYVSKYNVKPTYKFLEFIGYVKYIENSEKIYSI